MPANLEGRAPGSRVLVAGRIAVLPHERMLVILERLACGFYDTPDVIERVTERVAAELGIGMTR